jgi:hypothetical protein
MQTILNNFERIQYRVSRFFSVLIVRAWQAR